jgi:hypothetical protein
MTSNYNVLIEFTNGKSLSLENVKMDDKETKNDTIIVAKGTIVHFIRNSNNVNYIKMEKVDE